MIGITRGWNWEGYGAVALANTCPTAAARDAEVLDRERSGMNNSPAKAATFVVFNAGFVKLGRMKG